MARIPTIYRRNPHVAYRRVNEDYILMDVRTNKVLVLKADAGETLWRLWQQPRDTHALIAALPERADEYASLLSDLAAANIVAPAEEEAEPAAFTAEDLQHLRGLDLTIVLRDTIVAMVGTCFYNVFAGPFNCSSRDGSDLNPG